MTFFKAMTRIDDPRGRNRTYPLAGFLSSVLLAIRRQLDSHCRRLFTGSLGPTQSDTE